MGVYQEEPFWLPVGITRTLELHDSADSVGFRTKISSAVAHLGGTLAEIQVYVPGTKLRALIAELTEIADRRGL